MSANSLHTETKIKITQLPAVERNFNPVPISAEKAEKIAALGLSNSPKIPEKSYPPLNPINSDTYRKLLNKMRFWKQEHPDEPYDNYVIKERILFELNALLFYTLLTDRKWNLDQFEYDLNQLSIKVDHIRFEQLVGALQVSADYLNRCKLSDYTLGIADQKSISWVASLVMPWLHVLPSNTIQLGKGGTLRDQENVPKAEAFSSTTKETIVLFDDASYSGNQLSSYIQSFSEQAVERNERKRVFVIVPFMTNMAQKKIKSLKLKNIQLHLITSSKTIEAAREILNDKEFDWIVEIGGHEGASITYTDWKTPDPTSTMRALKEDWLGIIPNVPCPYKETNKV